MAAIHGNLKQLRQSRGWTQEEVARQMALTRQAVSSHESGRTQPDLETLKRYAEVYQVSVQDILYGGGQTQRRRRRVRRLQRPRLSKSVKGSIGCTIRSATKTPSRLTVPAPPSFRSRPMTWRSRCSI